MLRLLVAIRKGSAMTRLFRKEHLQTIHYHLLDNTTLFPRIRNGLMVSMLDRRSKGRGIESPLSISLFHSYSDAKESRTTKEMKGIIPQTRMAEG